ncbi:LacI family DNA-binding transcriptional regulator [Deinococcus deserti]|uniref:Putative Transcriptional regulator, LacI family n=1 Tax=Deinococcus deserti (strain DSM 17065 / CIP 109153 / LMG 22923 / VCD115) TaxID=546414 RepID=C1CZX2_DEIDV|nr:LacI family DNA-binding transcriptional regulator [Deinococcus deserti]ACO45224.2 putative Transcriptional regulator, LacI family [Deinococcus deserti VCD115]
MRKPTIQDVARRAGVGVGTVSRVLNNHVAVKGVTRETVLKAIADLEYTPNPHARRIAGGKSYTISVLLPMLTTEFYTRLLDGLEAAFQEARYDVAIFPLLDRSRLERYLGSHTLAYQADGLVMATYNLTTLFHERRMRTQQPTVLVDAYTDNVDCAYMDNVTGGRLAGEYASSLPGAVYAIWVETELDQLFTTRVFEDRRSGFLDATKRAGREVSGEFITSFDTLAARNTAASLLDELRATPGGLPATVFASADLLAGAVLDEAHARGIKVGEELRIIGFDDQPWAAARGLTTLHQPVESMGYEAAQLLLSRLNGHRGPPRARRFEPTLVRRETA